MRMIHLNHARTQRKGRRDFLKGVAALPLALLSACDSKPIARLGERLVVRPAPRRPGLFPMTSPPLTRDELIEVLYLLLPPKTIAYDLGYILHVIRTWGPRADFPDLDFVQVGLRGSWGRRMVSGLLNNVIFRSITKGASEDLIIPSEFGVQIRCRDDGGFAYQFGIPHAGDYFQVLADLGIESNAVLRASDGKDYHLSDALNDEARRTSLHGELEWAVGGLSRYLEDARWENRQGEDISFDAMVVSLIERGMKGLGACYSCHVPYTLATLYSAGRSLLSERTLRRVAAALASYRDIIVHSQLKSGHWDPSWIVDNSHAEKPLWGREDLDLISVTGHLLEYFSITPVALRPPEPVLLRGARALLTLLRDASDLRLDYHAHAPISHAVNALMGLSGYWFATEFAGDHIFTRK
jgi:hypothetical protein